MDLEFDLEIAIEGGVERGLKKALSKLKKEHLEETYELLADDELDEKVNKKQLANDVYEILNKKETIDEILNNMILPEYRELEEIYNKGGISEKSSEFANYLYLKTYGIIQIFNDNGKVYKVISNEIMNYIDQLDLTSYLDKVYENTRVYNLANSMSHLYGVFTLVDFLELYSKYYNYDFNKQQLNLDVIFKAHRVNHFIMSGYKKTPIIYNSNSALFPDQEVHLYSLIELIYEEEIPLKPIELNDLLKYNDLYYCEYNKYTNELKKYFIKHKISEEEAESIVESIILEGRTRHYYLIDVLNDILYESGFILDEDNIEEVLSLINKALDNTPKWGCNGWTDVEIALGKHKE